MEFGAPRMLLLMTVATAVVAAAILVLATGKWWTLLIPVGLHALGTTIVISGVMKRTEEGDKPDPVTQARLDDERAQGAR
jgi:membrane protein implicated in regulation of membrane protease activity